MLLRVWGARACQGMPTKFCCPPLQPHCTRLRWCLRRPCRSVRCFSHLPRHDLSTFTLLRPCVRNVGHAETERTLQSAANSVSTPGSRWSKMAILTQLQQQGSRFLPGDTATYKRHRAHPCISKWGKSPTAAWDSRQPPPELTTGCCSPQALPLDPRPCTCPRMKSGLVSRAPPAAERAQPATRDIGPRPRRGRCSAEHFPSDVHAPLARATLRPRSAGASPRPPGACAFSSWGEGALSLSRSQRSTHRASAPSFFAFSG